MLTGQFPPIPTGVTPSVDLQSEAVYIRNHNSKVPQPVARVDDRALSSDPERFRDAAQMKSHLKRAFAKVRR